MEPSKPQGTEVVSKLRTQYGCGLFDFAGTPNALYEHHLMFDNVVDAAAAGARDRSEALTRSVRDVLSQRWVRELRTSSCLSLAKLTAVVEPVEGDFSILADLDEVAVGITHVAAPFPAVIV